MASSLTLRSTCQVCGTRNKLLLCEGCEVVSYCCQNHRAADTKNHTSTCEAINKARALLRREQINVRDLSTKGLLPENILDATFSSCVLLPELEPCLSKRFDLVIELLKVKTHEAAESALNVTLENLRLFSDGFRLSRHVPGLFLRLGKEQECYDFIKGWAESYIPRFAAKTFQALSKVKKADPLEPLDSFTSEFELLSHAPALTLLELRLLLDVEALQNSILIGDKVPPEVLSNIRLHLVTTNIISNNTAMMHSYDHGHLIHELKDQVRHLYTAVQRDNPLCWPALLRPEQHQAVDISARNWELGDEVAWLLPNFYDSWAETPGAIDFIRNMSAQDGDARVDVAE